MISQGRGKEVFSLNYSRWERPPERAGALREAAVFEGRGNP